MFGIDGGNKPRVWLELRHLRANGKARVSFELAQCISEHRGGGGLSMHARDTNAGFTMQQRGEQDRAPNRWNAAIQRGLYLRVVLSNGRRIDHEIRFSGGDAPRVMADLDVRTAAFEFFDGFVSSQVGTANPTA